MQIRISKDTAGWDRFVEGNVSASRYHRSDWLDMTTEVFGHKSYRLEALSPTGDIDGLLPLVRLKSRLFGDYMVSLPYVNYGGLVSNGPDATGALLSYAEELAIECGCSHIEIRETDPVDTSWHLRSDKVSMILELPDSPEALSKSIGSKLRSQIKRPKRENPEVKIGGSDLITDFYAVFAENMRDLGTPVYSKRLFSSICNTLGDAVRIVVIYLGGVPVSAAFLIRDGDRMEIPWASSLYSTRKLSVNMLLYWVCLEHAIETGCKEFDFGRSSEGSGTFRFKKQWGAEPLAHHWYYWLGGGQEMPGLSPDNPKYALAIKAWQKLPLWISNRIGPLIVKNLP